MAPRSEEAETSNRRSTTVIVEEKQIDDISAHYAGPTGKDRPLDRRKRPPTIPVTRGESLFPRRRNRDRGCCSTWVTKGRPRGRFMRSVLTDRGCPWADDHQRPSENQQWWGPNIHAIMILTVSLFLRQSGPYYDGITVSRLVTLGFHQALRHQE